VKYNFGLDLSTDNSLSIIASRIKPNSNVLEFGPANGRLTRYLKNDLNCKVYIVEIDKQAAEEAKPFSIDAVVDDIENYTWLQKFKQIKFDHIIFADVLEHLNYPQIVLDKARELLADYGTVLISVPNIAHNSVVIDLLNNKFEYRKIGLMDDTHLRFFTEKSLLQLAESGGFVPIFEDAVYKKVEETEFNNYYDDLPQSLHYYLKNRPYNRVYQLVFEFMKSSTFNEMKNPPVLKRSIMEEYENYYLQLYIDSGNSFSEEQSIVRTVNIGEQEHEFDLSSFSNIKALRFDPINSNCIINVKEIYLVANDDSRLILNEFETNASWSSTNYQMVFLTEDPQIHIEVPRIELHKIVVGYELIQVDFDPELKKIEVIHLQKQAKELNDNLFQMNIYEEELGRNKVELERNKEEFERNKEEFKRNKEELERNKEELARNKGELERIVQKLELATQSHNEIEKQIQQILSREEEKERRLHDQANTLNDLINSNIWNINKKVKMLKRKE
jgi:SAM-dependent methyltransferase